MIQNNWKKIKFFNQIQLIVVSVVLMELHFSWSSNEILQGASDRTESLQIATNVILLKWSNLRVGLQ